MKKRIGNFLLIGAMAVSLLLPCTNAFAVSDEATAALARQGVNAGNLDPEDPTIDLNGVAFSGTTATIGFTMYLEPDSEFLNSSDTIVTFENQESGLKFAYRFSHLTDYDTEKNLCTGNLQIPADDYFKNYNVSVWTVNNGLNGGNICYQETLSAEPGQTYPLYACAGSKDWLETEGKKVMQDVPRDSAMQTTDELQTKGLLPSQKEADEKEKARTETTAPEKEDVGTVTTVKEKRTDARPLLYVAGIAAVAVVVISIITKKH